jgi:2',3'-cyclic-nucleotide 2'-phosphodiesterase (5'-nucleotidase family)
MNAKCFSYLLVIMIIISCKTQSPQGDDGRIDITFVQVNDVYEIAPIEGGKTGGMARVATLKKQEQQKNPNTFLVMSGDFLSPSVYGTLTYEGKKIRGRQMTDAMNAAQFDLVCFGNHEFDISKKELQERIDESKFIWISANAFEKVNDTAIPFHHNTTRQSFPKYVIKTVTDADGTVAKIGFIGVVITSNPAEYVVYTDPVNTAAETYHLIKDSCDAVVAITHLTVKDDKRLADAAPGLAIILGGHEHGGKYEKKNGVRITKAESNARTAYVVKLHINKKNKKVKAGPELVHINEMIAADSLTDITVQKWVKIATDNYATSGFDAEAVLPYNGAPLEGRETYTRDGWTNLSQLIADAMLFAVPNADAAVFNTGSIRVDDVLTPPLKQYDILRTLPFGGGLRELDVTGDLLMQVLDAGLKNKGSGGWLQYGNIVYRKHGKGWLLKQQPIEKTKTYRIVVTDFLITGKESGLGFFTEKNPGVIKIYPAQTGKENAQSDIRLAIIRYLEQKK